MKAHPPARRVPRLALTRTEAAASLGMGPTSFDQYVRPYVKAFRRGKLRLYPVAELERWLDGNAELVLDSGVEKDAPARPKSPGAGVGSRATRPDAG